MKVLFVIYPSLGIGEVYTCLKLAEQLIEQGAAGYFFGPKVLTAFQVVNSENHCLLTGDAAENKKIFADIVRNFQPDLLVFTDYYMLTKNLQPDIPFDFDWLKESGIPCMVIDTIGNCRSAELNNSIYQNAPRYLTALPDWVLGILRPTPPHDPKEMARSERVIYYPVFTRPADKESRLKTREQYQLDPARKIVIFPLGPWIQRVSGGTEFQLYQCLLQIILRYLRLLDEEIDLYIFGDHPFTASVYQKVAVKMEYKNLPFLEGDKLIGAADLLITVNRFSNSLGRANQYHVPTLTFINTADIVIEDGQVAAGLDCEVSPLNMKLMRSITNKNGVIRKYQIFPESKIEIVSEFFERNPGFSKINPVCNLFDEKNAVNLLHTMLFEPNQIVQAESDYMQTVYNLPKAFDKIKELLTWNRQY